MAESLAEAVSRRRTFAIIAHPDAGKTTLTEKLLLFGGAIQLAGEVKAKKDRIQTRSDWMKIERERGISVVTSVMTFEYDDNVFNILDTPGHEDFADDTYRTLTAVDAAVMVIDAAKGIEPRTLKLFEVCRMRDIPIITFINKMDRESRDPFEILDEVEEKLALDTRADHLADRPFQELLRFLSPGRERRCAAPTRRSTPTPVNGPQAVADRLPENERAGLHRRDWSWRIEACRPFDREAFLEGHLTPVFFGSALRNFGVRDLINALGDIAPPPRDQVADIRTVHATEDKMTAFVFKIQANMDPNHRDRIAFARICSGKLERGMKARLARTGKQMGLTAPQFFFASQRQLADTAYAGDVVGIPNHGTLRIGDTLTEGEASGVPGRAELLAGNPAPRASRGCDEGQEAEGSAAADGRRRRRAAVFAGRRLAGHRRRRRRAAARRAEGAAAGRIRPAGLVRNVALFRLPLDVGRSARRPGQVRHRQARRHRPRSRRRPGVPGAGRLSRCATSPNAIRPSRWSPSRNITSPRRRDFSIARASGWFP